jgi:hypothetical protein
MKLREVIKEMDSQKKFAKRGHWEDKYLYLISKAAGGLGYVVGLMHPVINDSHLFIPTEEELAAGDYELIHD